MILGKLWRTIQAQLNKLVSFFWEADPIAAMQLEYDRAVAQLREGRVGPGRVPGVRRAGRAARSPGTQANVNRLEATVKTCLKQGDREAAGRFVLELQRARQELAENQAQLQLHEQAYENNLLKIKHAGGNLAEIRDKIARYDADLKMSSAEAEMARLAQEFPRRRDHRLRQARIGDPGAGSTSIEPRCGSPSTSPAKGRRRPSARKRQPRTSSPRMHSGSSNGKWACGPTATPQLDARPRQRRPHAPGQTERS